MVVAIQHEHGRAQGTGEMHDRGVDTDDEIQSGHDGGCICEVPYSRHRIGQGQAGRRVRGGLPHLEADELDAPHR
jgi:hypothetical protein